MTYADIAVWSRIIGTVITLAILWWVFARYIAPAIVRAQEAKNAELSHAEQRRDAAKAEVDAAISALAEADRDAEAIRRRGQDEARRDREKALADAREAGERVLRNAEGELDRARGAARAALRVELIEKALRAARETANARVDTGANAELIRAFAATLERGGRRG